MAFIIRETIKTTESQNIAKNFRESRLSYKQINKESKDLPSNIHSKKGHTINNSASLSIHNE